MTLGLLHPSLAHHIVNTLGWQRLRPLQEAAAEPLLAGSDALLLAPTAGGKTEAALFPLLTRLAQEGWEAPALLYLAPLKALLNNLLPRLETYAGWLGRRAAVWHGDVTTGVRERHLREPPDLLLTTPESLEAMLVSSKVDHRRLFAALRAVVVDEVHAFAADDRGWHLLAVLERLSRVAGRELQRVGLSATVGNPEGLLDWLQGSYAADRIGQVVAPEVSLPAKATRARRITPGIGGVSFAISRAVREVLLGADPPVRLTTRAESTLAKVRETPIDTAHPGGTIISRAGEDVRWWTWAGYRTNATIKASLSAADQAQSVEDFCVRLRSDITAEIWKTAVIAARERLCLPDTDDTAIDGLKFSDALPRHLAEATLSARLADLDGAKIVLGEYQRFHA